MRLLLSEVARSLGLSPAIGEKAFDGYSIDSRMVAAGDLFFAIAGPHFDGHDFVEGALQSGAAAAVVSRAWAEAHPAVGPVLAVADPVAALGELALEGRRRWAKPVVGVTGSNGKTTTKDAIAALMAVRYRVSKTVGNFNNEIGLPLSILRIADKSEAAVVEMGMNHRGEIRRLCAIAEPTVGVVTNVSGAHLGNFSSVDEIALAKRELIESLAPEGTAVLNADDERVAAFAEIHAGPSVTFGLEKDADITASEVESHGAHGMTFNLGWRGDRGRQWARVHSPLLGRHNLSNVLAAIAACCTFDIDPASLGDAVAQLRPSALRGEVQQLGEITLLKDCYNANPSAVAAMLQTLAQTPGKRKIAVLGEMLELGSQSVSLHREIGAEVAALSVDLLVTVQGDARAIADGAVEAGFPASHAYFFSTAAEAGEFLAGRLENGDVVLLKASRGVALEQALPAIEQRRTAR